MFTEVLTASAISRANDEDLSSQVNYMWTGLVLGLMGILITMVQYVGDPIHCLCPAQLTEAQCNYTKALCWVKHNYFVHEDNPIALVEDDRYELTVAYYPWVPWILFSMAVMLNLPHVLWKTFAPTSGLDLNKFIAQADTHETLDNLGRILLLWLGKRKRGDMGFIGKTQKVVGSCGLFWCGRHQRSYLCGLLLLTKLGYLLVSLSLFFILNAIIDENWLTYGVDVVQYFLDGTSYDLVKFPIYTVCDIKIRQLANVQTYSFQCILPLNMYNQKICLFLWFWFIFISIMNAHSLVKWCLHFLSYANRRRFVKNYVSILYHLLEKKARGKRRKDRNANTLASDGGAEADAEDDDDDGGGGLTFLPGTAAESCGDRESTSSPTRPRRVRVTIPEASSSLRPRFGRRMPPSERPVSSIEEAADSDPLTDSERAKKRHINRITNKMMKEFGHDGVVVFRVLENAVGVVIANRIFQELYEQLDKSGHFS